MKKNININGLNKKLSDSLNSMSKESKIYNAGISGDDIAEPVPNYINSKGDEVIKGGNNNWIVFGRDRPASRLSGYGGLGDTQAASIDIVVGRMGAEPKDDVYVDPNFKTDSARIYISQKTDIDKNFSLVPAGVGNSISRSGIGIKADSIRIIGREGIKLVTGVDQNNSQGGEITAVFGIDLIAGNNDEDVQPLVKGDNLKNSLDELADNVENLSGILSTFLVSQMDFNASAAIHYHYSPFFGIPTTPSDVLATKSIEVSMKHLNDCLLGLQKFKVNIVSYRNNYLRNYGKYYINSKYNKVN
jgi:hypothetical protein